MRPITVGAYMMPGMILERVKPQGTVTDKVTVSAVGEQGFLALDPEGKEHHFHAGEADGYYMTALEMNLLEKT